MLDDSRIRIERVDKIIYISILKGSEKIKNKNVKKRRGQRGLFPGASGDDRNEKDKSIVFIIGHIPDQCINAHKRCGD
jgi:hypothetical protein